VPEPFARKSPIYGKPRQQNQGNSYGGSHVHISLGTHRVAHSRCKSEISNDGAWSSLIHGNISHTDGAFLLVRPRMPSEIVIERLVATVETFDLVLLFETTMRTATQPRIARMRVCVDGRLLSMRDRQGSPARVVSKNLYTRKREVRCNAFERGNQVPCARRFSFTKNAMTALSFPHGPAEQRQGVGKKSYCCEAATLLLTTDHPILGGSQISLKLDLRAVC